MFLIGKSYWEVKNTKQKGKGVFAKKNIPKGTVIGDYTGKLVRYENIDYEKERRDMYLMYYSDKFGIYPTLSKPGVHLINHSCSPNCWLYKFKDRTLVFALRDINPKEEITINYLLPPKTNCKDRPHTCFCGSLNCKKTMHLTESDYIKWQSFQKENWPVEKNLVTKNKLTLLNKYPPSVNESYIVKLIDTKLAA